MVNYMNKYKVCVYAICKNEEKFVDRWYNSMKEADYVYVLDTGSTDKTVKKLRKLGAVVTKKKIVPWRFDVARNLSLDLVPEDADICVCTDLDEVFLPGWREKLESAWDDDTTRAKYNYNWRLDKDGFPLVNFYIEKIHSRNGYKWTHPVHEVLTPSIKEKCIVLDNITLNHYPDESKSRSNYLPLLELSVKEDPNDDRNMHYLGREYMYYGRWNDSIDTLIKHLKLPTSTWKAERCASMRFIGRDYIQMGRYEEAEIWLDKAINEEPTLRDPYMERAFLAYIQNDWIGLKNYCNLALDIKTHPKTYINEVFSWDGTVYDLLSIAEYNLGNHKEALMNVDYALQYSPEDKRLLDNKKLYISKIKET